jgi:hypothetical protein
LYLLGHVWNHNFWTLALAGGEWSASRPYAPLAICLHGVVLINYAQEQQLDLFTFLDIALFMGCYFTMYNLKMLPFHSWARLSWEFKQNFEPCPKFPGARCCSESSQAWWSET